MDRRKKVKANPLVINPNFATSKELKEAYSARKKAAALAEEEAKKAAKRSDKSRTGYRRGGGSGVVSGTIKGIHGSGPSSRSNSRSNSRSRSSSAKLEETPDLSKIPQKYLLEVLNKKFGKEAFRNKQEEIIRASIEGNDVLVILPTGHGKSLTYQFPAVVDLKDAVTVANAEAANTLNSSISVPLKKKLMNTESPFQPIIKHCGVTVVVSPLLSLMHNQVSDLLSNKNIHAVTLNGNTPAEERKKIILDLTTVSTSSRQCFFSSDGGLEKNSRQMGPQTQLLYVSPELCETSSFRSVLEKLSASNNLRRFVIDEAHCCVEWGLGFRNAYIKLSYFREQFPHIPITALTATASSEVQSRIIKILKLNKKFLKTFITTPNRPNLHYEVCYLPDHDLENDIMPKIIKFLKEYKQRREEMSAIINQQMELIKVQAQNLAKKSDQTTIAKSSNNTNNETENKIEEMFDWWSRRKPSSGAGVIYCRKRETVDEVTFRLKEAGFDAHAYHAGLPTAELEQVLNNWVNDKPGYSIVIATVAFGMGIDKQDVRFVIHVDLPGSIEAYFQQSGRAGRDGKGARCILFYSLADKHRVLALSQFKAEDQENEMFETESEDEMEQAIDDGISANKKFIYKGGSYNQNDSNSSTNNITTKKKKRKARYQDPDKSFEQLFEVPPVGIKPGLRWLIKYCEKTNACRHLYLCKYFNKDVPNKPTPEWCDFACDYCKDPGYVSRNSRVLSRSTRDWYSY